MRLRRVSVIFLPLPDKPYEVDIAGVAGGYVPLFLGGTLHLALLHDTAAFLTLGLHPLDATAGLILRRSGHPHRRLRGA